MNRRESHPHAGVVGRFAPSPTGALHTGSLVAAIGSYLMAKHAGGDWLLRLDDLDTRRQLPGMADDIMRTLELFGLHWDGEVSRQSRYLEEYGRAFAALQQQEVVYPCSCSRREIAGSASAPHHHDDGIPYPGTCRGGINDAAVVRSWRVRVPEEEICFVDFRKGHICQKLPDVSGDFALRRGDGEFAYQLAVVVDDFLTGVNQVVRGDDLLSSTPRQIYLQRLLGYPEPEYCHLPLVTGPDGMKLSKRDYLISHQLGSVAGRERAVLLAVLRFLGLNPPRDLDGAPCGALLEWGVAHFDPSHIPTRGGVILP
ncbi:MAG: tRNA glutamyl-Q(34) synthetase GluQRS [Desulfuromonadaceae bacterium]|nr:tRNA glutamyl-Q(34) synthetase GluQRS [Desulfuromonadaceae bacterium]MDD5105533.1 tRNA glutamyl-Q(34) synthetase GluQRS [Desulfuromonadaceae bacterium]